MTFSVPDRILVEHFLHYIHIAPEKHPSQPPRGYLDSVNLLLVGNKKRCSENTMISFISNILLWQACVVKNGHISHSRSVIASIFRAVP